MVHIRQRRLSAKSRLACLEEQIAKKQEGNLIFWIEYFSKKRYVAKIFETLGDPTWQ